MKQQKDFEEITTLLRYLVVIELSKLSMPQGVIAKHLHISKSTVNDMLKGAKKEKSSDAE